MSSFAFTRNNWFVSGSQKNYGRNCFKCKNIRDLSSPSYQRFSFFYSRSRVDLPVSLRFAQKYVFSLYSSAEGDSTASKQHWSGERIDGIQQKQQTCNTFDVSSGLESIQGKDTTTKKPLVAWRWRIFAGIFVSYMAYTICRSTFTFVAPLLLQSGILQLEHVGLVTSSFPLFYGISKLLGGLVVDNFSPRRILGLGLSLAGLTNVGLGLSDGYRWYAAWWGANGIAQGCGAGACARILTAWFRSSERGFWWALWSCSANIGGVLAPLVSGSLARKTTWRIGMIAPGIFSVLTGISFSWLIRDTPKEAGLVVGVENDLKQKGSTQGPGKNTNTSFEYIETFVKGVLGNRTLWLLALSYFFVYFVKTSIRSFFHIYLMQQKGCHATDAAYRVSGMDIGGLAGTFISGILSDRLEGHRVPVVVTFLLGLVVTLLVVALLSTMTVNHVWLDFLSVMLFGFFLSGPTCLIGLIGAEQSDRRTVATATGLLGYISYLGAAMAGLPVTVAIRRFGWVSYFSAMIFSSFLSVAFLLPLSKAKAEPVQKHRVKQHDHSHCEVDGNIID